MREFLLVVPRSEDHSVAMPMAQARLRSVAQGYSTFVGSDYEPTPTLQTPSRSVAVLSYRRRGVPEMPRPSGDRWAITAGSECSREIAAHVSRRAGRLVYDQPVWGSYAAVLVERWTDRVTAWNTVPAFEAVHWGQDKENTYISNRPLLVALALADGDRHAISLSTDYASEYLLYGYSITGQAPFDGVTTLPVDKGLALHKGVAEATEVPPGLEAPLPFAHTLQEGADALTAALESATDRCVMGIGQRPLQLRMSGGIDSRVLLGLLRGRTVDVRAVTFGAPQDGDVRIAQCLTNIAGVRFEYGDPTPSPGDTALEQINAALVKARGMPLSEPHTIRYQGAEPASPGEAIMMGQWPLFKGGAAKKMRYSDEQALAVVLGNGSSAINAEFRHRFDDWLAEWFHTVPAVHSIDRLYLFSRYFRSGRYLQAHIAHYGYDSMIAYPFGDAEVAAVSDALTHAERVSMKAIFGALRDIWPEATRVPLDQGKLWRFEVRGFDDEWSGPHFAERNAPLADYSGVRMERLPAEYSSGTAVELSRSVLDSPRTDVLMGHLTREFACAVNETATSGVRVLPQGFDGRHFNKMLWRLGAVDAWMSGGWLGV